MAKAKTDQVFIGIDDKVIELTGADKEAFLADQKQMQVEFVAQYAQFEKQKQLKIDAYTKLGLTEEEINAIL
jgi:hypothetical protein